MAKPTLTASEGPWADRPTSSSSRQTGVDEAQAAPGPGVRCSWYGLVPC